MRSQSLRALVLTGLSAAAVAVVPATATAAPAGHENVGTMDLRHLSTPTSTDKAGPGWC